MEKNPKSSDYTFPFEKASISLVKLLYDMLGLGDVGEDFFTFIND
jgi:hypothetical protein